MEEDVSQYGNVEKEEEGGDDDECDEEKDVDENIDDDRESLRKSDGDEHGGVDLFGDYSDPHDVNHENLKLPVMGSDGEEEDEGSSSVDGSMYKESV